MQSSQINGANNWVGTKLSVAPFDVTFRYTTSWGSIMPTAIVSVYTPKGFIIGADGMRRDQRTRDAKDLEAQKIFFIEHDNLVLAYGWSGATGILNSQNERAFSFPEATAKIGKTIMPAKNDSFSSYVHAFSGKLTGRLMGAKKSGRIAVYPEAGKGNYGETLLARVLLVGYFRGRPCRAEIEFSHLDGTLFMPSTQICDGHVPMGFHKSCGSETIYRKFEQTHLEPRSLEGAQALARSYIQACIDNQSKFEDCKDIGGHIHIAVVTPHGAEWIIPPAKVH